MKIYSRTGDKGMTSLYSGQRCLKNSPYMAVMGHIDECSSTIGVALAHLAGEEMREQLEEVQKTLSRLCAVVAMPLSQAQDEILFEEEAAEQLEQWIDEMAEELPVLKVFILPGGHPAAAFLHLARAVCRRAERESILLYENKDITGDVLAYLNRLSDYLFMAARYVNYLTGEPERLGSGQK